MRARLPVPPSPADVPLGDHVTVLGGAELGKYPDGNSVLVAGRHGALVIDPSETVSRRGGVPGTIDQVLVSHAHEDHIAGLSTLDHVPVHVHRADAAGLHSLEGMLAIYGAEVLDGWRQVLVEDFHFAPRPDAVSFDDGALFDLGGVSVTVVHLAGHTRGHCGFLIEPDGVAFVGDIDLSSFGPYYGDHWSDLDDFVDSLRRVGEIDARHYVTFHHKGVIDGRAEFLRQLAPFAAVIDQRDARLLAMLPGTLDELVEVGIVYRPGTRPALFGTAVERRTITLHLDRLQRTGLVVRHDGMYHRA